MSPDILVRRGSCLDSFLFPCFPFPTVAVVILTSFSSPPLSPTGAAGLVVHLLDGGHDPRCFGAFCVVFGAIIVVSEMWCGACSICLTCAPLSPLLFSLFLAPFAIQYACSYTTCHVVQPSGGVRTFSKWWRMDVAAHANRAYLVLRRSCVLMCERGCERGCVYIIL